MGGFIDLKVKVSSFVLDPDDFEPSKVVRTPVAKPTEGPHRYSIYVPHDEAARISIGKAHPKQGEDGIAIETLHHIHLSTTTKTEGQGTYLHLGLRPVNTGHSINKGADGYALFTNGSSSHYATQEVSLVSQENALAMSSKLDMELKSFDKGIIFSAKEDIKGTAEGSIELSAGKEEVIDFSFQDKVLGGTLLFFEAFDFLAPAGKPLFGKAGEHVQEAGEAVTKTASLVTGMVESNAAKWKEKFIASHAKTAAKVLKHAEALTSIMLGFKKTMKKAKKAESGWEAGVAGYTYIVESTTKILAIFKEFEKKPKDPGQIKLEAVNGISLETDKSVSIYAADAVSLAGFMGNSITGLGCTVKAYKDVSIWGGMGAAVKALAGDVGISTDFGEVSVKGYKAVELASEKGEVKATAEKDVQISSVSEKVMVHGMKGCYLGAGPGAGHGLIAKDSTLYLGCLKTAEKFNTVAIDLAEDCITMNKSLVAVKNGGDHKLEIQKSGVRLMGSKIEVKAQGNIKLKGATVNIN